MRTDAPITTTRPRSAIVVTTVIGTSLAAAIGSLAVATNEASAAPVRPTSVKATSFVLAGRPNAARVQGYIPFQFSCTNSQDPVVLAKQKGVFVDFPVEARKKDGTKDSKDFDRADSYRNCVRWVQTRLVAHGYVLAVDGDYGRESKAAVKALNSRGLKPTGRIDDPNSKDKDTYFALAEPSATETRRQDAADAAAAAAAPPRTAPTIPPSQDLATLSVSGPLSVKLKGEAGDRFVTYDLKISGIPTAHPRVAVIPTTKFDLDGGHGGFVPSSCNPQFVPILDEAGAEQGRALQITGNDSGKCTLKVQWLEKSGSLPHEGRVRFGPLTTVMSESNSRRVSTVKGSIVAAAALCVVATGCATAVVNIGARGILAGARVIGGAGKVVIKVIAG